MPERADLPALRARIAAIPAGAARAPRRPSPTESRLRPTEGRDALALGLAPMDACLPGGGLAPAAVHAVSGSGAFGFLALLLGRLSGGIIWCRQAGARAALYPHGLRRHGLNPETLIAIEGQSSAELLACAEEALRSGAAGAVVAELPAPIGLTASRRLQLAAQAGGAMGFLLLGDGAARRGALSAATVWQAEAAPSPIISRLRWRVTLARCRNGRTGTWTVEWNAETDRLAVVPEAGDGKARPAARQQVAG